MTMAGSNLSPGEIGVHDRAHSWKSAVQHTFPGLTVQLATAQPVNGMLRNIALGTCQAFLVDSAPVEVRYNPTVITEGMAGSISLMLQRAGRAEVAQGENHSVCFEGEVCLIDETRAFRLSSEASAGITFVRLPRAPVLGMYPALHGLFARAFSIHDPGTRVLAGVLQRLPEFAGAIDQTNCHAAVTSLVNLLGVTGPVAGVSAAQRWRVRRAVDFINSHLSVAGIRAEDIAEDQQISRRQLDSLMLRDIGETIAGLLWRLRLERAADALRSYPPGSRSIADISFQSGFEDAAHFSRAFKRRYGDTPSAWRRKSWSARPGAETRS